MENKYIENWDFFFTEIAENPASISLDLGLNRIAPVKESPVLLTAEIEMKDPQDNGLSSKSESEKLFEIEDTLHDELVKLPGSIKAGRVTTDGARLLYYYVSNGPEAKKAAKSALKKFSSYTADIYTENDAKWDKYKEYLYPSGYEMHTIMNRHVVENLRSKGDDLSIPREVDHYIFFSTESGKSAFLNAAEKLGYKKTSERVNEKNPEHPITLRVTRTDAVEYNEVCDYTSELYDLAEEHDGVYDGWETRLVTPEKAAK